MCKIMGKDFEQYLPLMMRPVLIVEVCSSQTRSSLKPEVALLDSMYYVYIVHIIVNVCPVILVCLVPLPIQSLIFTF